MRVTRAISTVEVHTGGEPFRIVTSGVPRIPGSTILARRKWVGENCDELRRALMFEPRGHADMYGGLLTEPVSESADFGVIFMHNVGYSSHCGHGVIALSTAAVELGWVQRTAPETRVGIDAPCGFIEAFVAWDGEHAGCARFVNVPSFLWKRDVTVQTASFGPVTGDIAYGGAFYFYVDGAAYGLQIRESEVERLKDFGMEVKNATNAAFSIVHPELTDIKDIYGTIISGVPRHPGSSQANCCVFADREVDRSPTVPVPRAASRNYTRAANSPQARHSSTSRSSGRSSRGVSCLAPASGTSTPSFPKSRETPSSAASPTGSWTAAIRRPTGFWCGDMHAQRASRNPHPRQNVCK